MMRKSFVVAVLLLFIYNFSDAQAVKKTALVKGKLINTATKTPFNDLKVAVPELNVFTTSDGDGNFEISEVPYGTFKAVISGLNAKRDTISFTVNSDLTDLKEIGISPTKNQVSIDNEDIPTIAITDNNSSGSDIGDGGSNDGEELLIASRDPFVQTTVYVFGAYFFKPRGQRNQNEAQINGITINNAQTGFLSWGSQLGNQSDVFRGRDVRYGLEPSQFTFGGVNGSTYIQSTAADFQQETKISYSNTDRLYRNRIMFTTSTGMMKNGWAFTFSANHRWSQEGYIPGSFFDGYAYYAGASKKLGKGVLSLTTFGVPMRQTKFYMQTQEAYDLAGTNYYNSNWGYQDGDKRASHIEKLFQPTTILNYEYKPSDDTRWNTAIGYQFGKDRLSNIDYYNVKSPFGNYYQNMPSYYYTMNPPQTQAGNAVAQQIMSNRNLLQIDWTDLYAANNANIQTMENVNGIPGNTVTGKQSEYVMYDKINDLKKFTLNSNIERNVTEHTTLTGGVTFTSQETETYKQLTDLLGGQYYTNYNEFAALQYVSNPNYYQNNLNVPNEAVHTGDKYGYDYSIHSNDAVAWGQVTYSADRFNLFAAATLGDDMFYREGFMRNGLAANNSFGKSATHSFFDYAAKGGVTYKIDKKNFLYINAAYFVMPPTADHTYISASTRDYIVTNPTVQKTEALEGGYLLKSNNLNARVVGYLASTQDATDIKRFYDDDPSYRTFINYVMQGENTKSVGTELMLNYKLSHDFSVTGVAAIGKSIYTNRPTISVYQDNDTVQRSTPNTAYIKNYYLPAGPQSAYTLGINYHGKSQWFGTINFSYYDRNYVEINPNRRTQQAIGLITPGSQQYNEIMDQEKLPSAFVVDLHGGKTIQLSRKSDFVKKNLGSNAVLVINVGINNLLDNKDVIVKGSEQLRFDFINRNPAKFANLYQYEYGINYYVNISLRF